MKVTIYKNVTVKDLTKDKLIKKYRNHEYNINVLSRNNADLQCFFLEFVYQIIH